MGLSAQTLSEVRFAGRRTIRAKSAFVACSVRGGNRQFDRELLEADEQQFVTAVFEKSGLAIDDYRHRPLRRRLAAALRRARAPDVGKCLSAVQADESLATKLINTLLIGYTTPFRDLSVFGCLRRRVLPELLAEHSRLQIWSAGCSNGAELYSLALLLAELDGLGKSTLRGTDGRAAAIAEARKSAKDFWASVPAPFTELKQRVHEAYFLDQVRRIDWQIDNILSIAAEARFNLVLCRNVCIYLQPSAAATLWEVCARSLVPDGFLVTGKAEKPLPSRQWRCIDTCIYQVVKP